jgi:hypothetical protein
MPHDDLDVVSFAADSLQGDDGTGSPWLSNLDYNGKREDIILGLDDGLGLDELGLDDFGNDDTVDIRPPPTRFGDDDINLFGEDFLLGADMSTTDLSCLGIDEPMVWGSDSPDAWGWDELGSDYFGWNPFKAVKKAVKSVGKVATKAVKTVAKTAAKGAKAAGSVANTLAKSKIVKGLVTGAAIVFPAVGVPLAAGLATAAAVAAATKSKIPSQAAAAKQIVLNTHKLATTPGPDQKAAQVSLAAMAMAANAKKAEAAKAVVARNAATKPTAPAKLAVVSRAPAKPAAPAPAAAAAHPAIVQAQSQALALPALPAGHRRISNAYGRHRVTHDVSPQGVVATYVT